jgi:UDP-2,3-diacylglucosamine pyrophosphatase LpxH
MYDAIIISDLHLGSNVCQSKEILKFLHLIDNLEIITDKLIINGDFFDSWDFRRLSKQHWKILSAIRKISKKIQIVWINGNHDGPSEVISHLIGVEVAEEFILQSGFEKIMIIHGHQFDDFIVDHPIITEIADFFYRQLQKIHIFWAKNAKKYSKTFLRCSEKIEKRAKEYAFQKDCRAVCCGHTHLELKSIGLIDYYNSGCWTELPCSYLTLQAGNVQLNHFFTNQEKK